MLLDDNNRILSFYTTITRGKLCYVRTNNGNFFDSLEEKKIGEKTDADDFVKIERTRQQTMAN